MLPGVPVPWLATWHALSRLRDGKVNALNGLPVSNTGNATWACFHFLFSFIETLGAAVITDGVGMQYVGCQLLLQGIVTQFVLENFFLSLLTPVRSTFYTSLCSLISLITHPFPTFAWSLLVIT